MFFLGPVRLFNFLDWFMVSCSTLEIQAIEIFTFLLFIHFLSVSSCTSHPVTRMSLLSSVDGCFQLVVVLGSSCTVLAFRPPSSNTMYLSASGEATAELNVLAMFKSSVSVSDDLNRWRSATYFPEQESAKERWRSGSSRGSHRWLSPRRPELLDESSKLRRERKKIVLSWTCSKHLRIISRISLNYWKETMLLSLSGLHGP